MKLYDFPFSPNSRKVRAVAYELGIALETQRIDLLTGGQRSPEFLAKNPNGRVPVLEDGDLILWESAAIIRYLAAGSSLLPTAGGRRWPNGAGRNTARVPVIADMFASGVKDKE